MQIRTTFLPSFLETYHWASDYSVLTTENNGIISTQIHIGEGPHRKLFGRFNFVAHCYNLRAAQTDLYYFLTKYIYCAESWHYIFGSDIIKVFSYHVERFLSLCRLRKIVWSRVIRWRIFTYILTYILIYLLIYLITYLLTYLLHGAETFLRS